MDGVLLQSNHIKHDAMLALFDVDAQKKVAIAQYNQAHGGVPRKQKFAHIWTCILSRPYDAQVERQLAGAYERALEEALSAAPLVEGVDAFIAGSDLPCFVCTAAPEDEASRVLAGRGLLAHFKVVYGGSTTKAQALAQVASGVGRAPERVLFFGDSKADLEAARSAAVRFVGVTREKVDFLVGSVPTIFNFEDRKLLDLALHAAATGSFPAK
ncbi:HAD family hydrolase [Ideonella sp. TBM-1]|uniref:phosphoglycolate phosphatase n=2 Tax=Ideonella livida TaxID=2707176 RepID=A0A7C9TLY1_9BURK|nr:HAD family hydrolase [Ideonella livida]NDY92804.1 HAD family hydrolase [Ideonella livida]